MSQPISILNVAIDPNCNGDHSKIVDDIKIHIQYEVHSQIQANIEWKITYIGCVNDSQYDQVLGQYVLTPDILSIGVSQAELEAQAPDLSKIPKKEDLFGVTAIIFSASYNEQEFFRVGFYVYNNYNNPDLLEQDPQDPIINEIYRKILADKPRVTNYEINWNVQNTYQDQALVQLKQQNPNYATMMPDLFQSNGVFDQLNQIPTYNNPSFSNPTYDNNQQQNFDSFQQQQQQFGQQQQQQQQQFNPNSLF